MQIGVPKEIKDNECRVGLTPASVSELTSHGHSVFIQQNAGAAIDYSDEEYTASGATILSDPAQIFKQSDMIVKVKEPQERECKMLREGQVLFAYLHLAPDPRQTELLLDSGATCIAYETVTDDHGALPLLAPMSEVAGRMAAQAGAAQLENIAGGRGVLMGGVPGVAPAKVLIIGGGVVGDNAAAIARGMGADVTIMDSSVSRLRHLDAEYEGRIRCIYSTSAAIREYALQSDLVIGAVLIPGATAPKLLSRDTVRHMKKGAVVVDVAIDQGGCFETSRPTTHAKPTFVVDEVVHYCVTNMPGAVARTSTQALNNVTLPFAVRLAEDPRAALLNDRHLLNGLNIHRGQVTYQAVSEPLGYKYVKPEVALAN